MSQVEASPRVPEDQLKAALESLLFVAAAPIPLTVLARTTGWTVHRVRQALEGLAKDLDGRGLNLQISEHAVQLATDPQVAEVVRLFLGAGDDGRLSRGALETLSIVAFKQPVPRATIDAMRGVSSDYMLGRLKERGLIEEVGRAASPGRPLLYGTTFRFLEHFGLKNIRDLHVLLSRPEDGEVPPATSLVRTAAVVA